MIAPDRDPADAADPPNTCVAILRKLCGEEVRVTLATYAGDRRIDVRAFASKPGFADPQPTTKGIVLPIGRLGQLIEALQHAEREAELKGWIKKKGRPNPLRSADPEPPAKPTLVDPDDELF